MHGGPEILKYGCEAKGTTRELSKAKARSVIPYSAGMYVDCLPVELKRALTVVSLAAKPKRTLKTYNRKNDCSKRIVSHAVSAKVQ